MVDPKTELYARYLDPPWSPPSRSERAFLDAGEPLYLKTEHGPVRGRRWPAEGESRGRVLLAHGWAGRAGTWLVLAPILNALGLDAIAYDAPAHGESRESSERGKSHFFAFAATLLAASEAHGPLAGVVGHSFGASVIPYALNEGLKASRAVLVAPTARTESYLSRWAAAEGLSPEEEASVATLWTAEFGPDRLASTAPLLQAAQAKIPALVLHDEGDAEVPLADGEAVARAWPGATLARTVRLGHRRILLSPPAMRRTAEFLLESPLSPRAGRGGGG